MPPSNLKEEYESWNTRNDFEKFQSPLKSNSFCDNSDEGSINKIRNPSGENVRNFVFAESLTPQSKRPRPFLVTSSYKKKRKIYRKRNNKGTRKLLKRHYGKYRRKIKPCSECYCSGQSISEDSEMSDDSYKGTEYKHYHPKKLSKNIKVDLPSMQKVPCDDFEFKCLKSSQNLIDYTPESIFLRRLKQRSQNLNDINPNKKFMQLVNDGDKMSACSAKLHRKLSDTSKCISISDTKDSQRIKYPKCNSSKLTCSCHRDNTAVSVPPLSGCCTSEASEENRAKDIHKGVIPKIKNCDYCTMEDTNYEKRLSHTEKSGSRCTCRHNKERRNDKSSCQSKMVSIIQ